ncbi:MAG: DUF2062 domain-containing protein, partial [Rhodobacteraceae bacterium]|nr:DUF2062 domain-containing protein [Paracoccaceae bacterium]
PLTTPFFAVLAMSLGHWMMGVKTALSAGAIARAFENAGRDIWFNLRAVFTDEVTRWDGLLHFWHDIYVPYFIGALVPGIVISLIAYYITIPLVQAYQNARAAKAKERGERRRHIKEALLEAAQRLKPHRNEAAGDDDGPGTP